MNLPFGYLSVSQIRTYLRCPRQYEYQYIHRIRQPVTSALLLGRSFHAAIEKANLAKLEDGEILSVDDVKDTFSEAWDNEKDEVEWEEDEDQGKLKDDGLAVTTHYYEQVGQNLRPMMVEHGTTVDIDGIPVKVIIDLVEQGGRIRDFKTAKRTPQKDMAEKSIQLSTYALAYRQMTGEKETGATLDYTVNLKSGPKITQLETEIDEGRSERTKQLIKGVANAISAGVFFPVEEGMACGFCPFHDICKGGEKHGYATKPAANS